MEMLVKRYPVSYESYEVTPGYQTLFESMKPFLCYHSETPTSDGRTDRRMDRRTDKQAHSYIPPQTVCGGIINAV